jgi:hypothetical protein
MDEQAAAALIEIRLGQGERLVDPQPGPPQPSQSGREGGRACRHWRRE